MIVADRRELDASVRQRALQIQREELKVFTDNLQTLGTQSAFLAGLAWNTIAYDYEGSQEWNDWIELGIYVRRAATEQHHADSSCIQNPPPRATLCARPQLHA